MATETTAATPATASAAAPVIDYDKLAEAIAKRTTPAAAPAVATAAAPAVDASPAPKPLTAEDVARLLDQRDSKAAAAAERGRYISDKMKNLPDAYHALLGNDPSKWKDEEQSIRDKFRADLKALGVTAPNLGGEDAADAGTVITPGAAIDMSKMTATQKISLGMKQSKPARPPSSGTAR